MGLCLTTLSTMSAVSRGFQTGHLWGKTSKIRKNKLYQTIGKIRLVLLWWLCEWRRKCLCATSAPQEISPQQLLRSRPHWHCLTHVLQQKHPGPLACNYNKSTLLNAHFLRHAAHMSTNVKQATRSY